MLSEDDEFDIGYAHRKRRFKISESLNHFYTHDGSINAIFYNRSEAILALYIDVPQDGWFKQGESGLFLFFDVEIRKAEPPLEQTVWKNTVNTLLDLGHAPEIDIGSKEGIVLWDSVYYVNDEEKHYAQELRFVASSFQWFSLMQPESDADEGVAFVD